MSLLSGPLKSTVATSTAEASGGGGGGGGVPKWVYALAIGVPVTAALLYILFGPEDDGGSSSSGKKKKKEKVQEDVKTKSAAPAAAAVAPSPAKKSPANEIKKPSPPESATSTPSKTDSDKQETASLPTNPLDKGVALKNRGNKYFRAGRYDLAIKSYSEAIEVCPPEHSIELATFYQNRAAANDQLENLESVLSDCDKALNLNAKYTKALDRRAKVLRKQAQKVENFSIQVEKLKQSVEDITSVCLLEGFQKQEHLVLVDQLLKELGRAEAALASKDRKPMLPSKHYITQYLTSFAEDPIQNLLAKEAEEDMREKENGVLLSGFSRAKQGLMDEEYEVIVDACTEELNSAESSSNSAQLARLLRGTFYALSKEPGKSMDDLTSLINDERAEPKVRVNALIKRATLYIQMCKDAKNDMELGLKDFELAVKLDPDNADIYHHRGQVHLLVDEMNKAIVDFKRAVTLNPKYPIAYAQKLFTEYRCASIMGDVTKVNTVISDFYEAMEKHPDCIETYSLAAQVLTSEEKVKEADALYKKAIELDPANANLLVHRAYLALRTRGDVVEAVKLLEKALEIDELCEFAYETLGAVEVQRGNMERAVELYEKAIPIVNSELEMAHLYGLRAAAKAQITVSQKFGIPLKHMMGGM